MRPGKSHGFAHTVPIARVRIAHRTPGNRYDRYESLSGEQVVRLSLSCEKSRYVEFGSMGLAY